MSRRGAVPVGVVAVLVVLGVLAGAWVATLLDSREEPPGAREPPAAHGAAGQRAHSLRRQATGAALRVLHDWDARRAAAYATGSVSRLRDLYAPGSVAGARDVVLLRRYRARGLRLTGLRTQVLAVRVLDRGARTWLLRVTDRLADVTALRRGERVVLPRDTADARELRVVRGRDGRWRVSSVLEAR
jgi:hypothetical protein